ncbi:glycoside hydrolase family 1 protein [Spiroplasma alleghenense]|uniref:6-phospho-beta-glucosidase n=1 Tax=Spiroplasma alleghenense TaxID=216931 RepID=A0A345Z4M0_9MOLU|nr:glycoside hydrolase family 1 protein [Spiroplasma alleghenense]AXK51549.1 6-phospho-beta-glucosidase [Spiroplasma alleghenense]
MFKLENYPKGFLWGASTSAFQVEGASNKDGKGVSVVDLANHGKEYCDFSIASDFYHNYKEDIKLFSQLGMKSYRFSISWTRIYPQGNGEINQKGIDYYNDLINELVKYKIEPIVTIYHFDLPWALEEQGGWANRKLMLEAFTNYAKTLFENFGDRVKYWLTINEQNILTMVNMIGLFVPGVKKSPQLCYQESHVMTLAQALVIKMYHKDFKNQKGKIGPAPNIAMAYPASAKPEDVLAASNANVMRNWMYTDVCVNGKYNPIALSYFKQANIDIDFQTGDDEILENGKPDFIAFNYYSTFTVKAAEPNFEYQKNNGLDQQTGFDVPGMFVSVKNENLKANEYGWEIDPIGFRTTLRELYSRYLLPVMITENGIGVREELNQNNTVEDDYRIDYYKNHLLEMRKAITDGVEIISYNPWTAIDLVSSHQGFQKRYGFIYVNRDEHDLKDMKRYCKKSFYWYQDVIKNNGNSIK